MTRIQSFQFSIRNAVYQRIKLAIVEGKIAPGKKLNENEIASGLGVSRTPVREAISLLEKEGLVVVYPQRGAFVIQLTEKDIFELFLIRENLEGLAANLAAKKIDQTHLAKLTSYIRGFKEPFTENEIKRYSKEDFRFHHTIIMLSEAQRLINLISTLYDHIRIFRLTTLGLSDRMKSSLKDHRLLIEALRRKDSATSEERMRLHIRHVRDGVMENIKFFLGNGKKGPSQERRKKYGAF